MARYRQAPQIPQGSTVLRFSCRKRKIDDLDSPVVLTSRKKYKSSCYEPLNDQKRQIRLFDLFPGKKDDPICGQLRTVNLEDDPSFDAVSYVWGDPNIRFQVRIGARKRLMVPKSLEVALISLRLKSETRTLWVDAICINQEDLQERGHQVSLMKLVFSMAECVRVWLDVDVDPNLPAFRAVRRLQGPSIDDLFNEGQKTHELRQPRLLEDYGMEFWDPLFKVFAHPYWERVWTQQEQFLARKIHYHLPCGVLQSNILIRFYEIIIWTATYIGNRHNLFSQALQSRIFGHSQKFGKPLFDTLYRGFCCVKQSYIHEGEDIPTLLNFFLRATDLKVTDPRDRVFGLLGLCQDSSEKDVKPDYTITRNQA